MLCDTTNTISSGKHYKLLSWIFGVGRVAVLFSQPYYYPLTHLNITSKQMQTWCQGSSQQTEDNCRLSLLKLIRAQ